MSSSREVYNYDRWRTQKRPKTAINKTFSPESERDAFMFMLYISMYLYYELFFLEACYIEIKANKTIHAGHLYNFSSLDI